MAAYYINGSDSTVYFADGNVGVSFLHNGTNVNLAFKIVDTMSIHSGLQELRGT